MADTPNSTDEKEKPVELPVIEFVSAGSGTSTKWGKFIIAAVVVAALTFLYFANK